MKRCIGDCSDFTSKANKVGETALHHCCRIGKSLVHSPDEDVKIVTEALVTGKSPPLAATIKSREIPLHYAAVTGNFEVTRALLNNMNEGQVQLAVNYQSAIGWSPLLTASGKGHFKIVQLLLEKGAR